MRVHELRAQLNAFRDDAELVVCMRDPRTGRVEVLRSIDDELTREVWREKEFAILHGERDEDTRPRLVGRAKLEIVE